MMRSGRSMRLWLWLSVVVVAVFLLKPVFAHIPQIPAAYLEIFGIGGGAGQMYMESMYLPPVTTGPWSPAWSPDGRHLAFSMQGSLWKVSAEGGEALQIASSPYFDSEPAWSPDGRHLAFTRGADRALEIWVADSEGNNGRQLTRHKGISVNPRWSPDGDTIIYTSTHASAAEGRKPLGLWSVSSREGTVRPVLADDYQNITPSWSPDGTELVFVSNRRWDDKVILGTGGIWKLRPGESEPHLLLQEETSWHARPVWSPDGAKIAYMSFRGGHHQLWVLSARTANPIQLTFLESEVFTPAWSPDSKRIAYISNAGGKFTLWTVAAVGGPPSEVKIDRLEHRYAVGRLRVTVRERRTGRETAARVYVKASDGKPYAPRDAFHRHIPVTDDHYFHTNGSFTIELPVGTASVEVTKGFEYRPQRRLVEVGAGQTQVVELEIERLLDMPSLGWHSGDNHIHMNYGGIFDATPKSLLLEAEAEDLHVINDLVANRVGGRIYDMKYFEGRLNSLSTRNRMLYFNQEYRPSFAGHMALLNLKSYVFPAYTAGNTAHGADYPTNSHILKAAHDQGAIGGYVHPFLYEKGDDPANHNYGGAREFPVNAALGDVDYYDVMCIWSDEYVGAEVWYRLLNLGFKIPASAGTDAMTNYWRAPAIGTVRVYVHSGSPLDYQAWIRGLAGGRTFVTNGPILFLRVDDREPGDELRLPAGGPASVKVEAEAVSILPMETLDILQNGTVVLSVKAEDPYRVKLSRTLTVDRTGWLAARVTGPEKQHLLMDSYVYAHTTPVYLLKGDEPARSQKDATYFIRWIDRVVELLHASNAFDTPAQKQEVIEHWTKAREIYTKLAER